MSPNISVLMSIYNEKQSWIIEAMDSLLNQSYKDFEIILIIDNPENYEAIELCRQYHDKDGRVKLLINESNIGLANSLNKGFEWCQGKYIARMDADDVALPNRFESQINYMLNNEYIDLLATDFYYINENGNTIEKSSLVINNIKILDRCLKINNFILHPSWLMKREVFANLKGYQDFKCSQDYDFLLRVRSSGFEISILNEKLMNYRIRQNSTSVSKGYMQHLTAEYIKKINKNNDSLKKEEFEIFISKLSSNANEKKYLENQKIFSDFKGSKLITKKMVILSKGVFTNSFFRNKLYQIILMKINTRKM